MFHNLNLKDQTDCGSLSHMDEEINMLSYFTPTRREISPYNNNRSKSLNL